jgi:hypothetical protein
MCLFLFLFLFEAGKLEKGIGQAVLYRCRMSHVRFGDGQSYLISRGASDIDKLRLAGNAERGREMVDTLRRNCLFV